MMNIFILIMIMIWFFTRLILSTLYGFVSPGSGKEETAGLGLTTIIAIDVDVPRAGLP